MTKQIITLGKVVKCVTYTPYDKEELAQMKKAGYKIKEVECKEEEGKADESTV